MVTINDMAQGAGVNVVEMLPGGNRNGAETAPFR
jgi:hypothetical protein